MIEALDRKVSTPEQRAGKTLLRCLDRWKTSVRIYGEASNTARLDAIRLGAAERLYDALPRDDVQVRDAFDDALLCAGWRRT